MFRILGTQGMGFAVACWLPVLAFGQAVPLSVQGGVGLTSAWFADEVTETRGSIGLQFGLSPRLYQVLAVHVEGGLDYLGMLCFDTGGGCEEERQRSTASQTFMLSGSIGAGMLTPPLLLGPRSHRLEVALGLFAGREWVRAGVGRADCLNCRVPGLNVRGGLYFEPVLEVGVVPGVALGAAYRRYSTAAGVRGRFMVRVMMTEGR